MVVQIKIAIVDDDQEFLKTITKYLSKSIDMLVISTATTKEQALKLPEIYDLDIMLMDINLTENKCDGILIANQILAKYLKKPKLIMLTNYNDKELIQNSFLAGAFYYVLKTSFKSLPDTIRNIHNNDSPINTIIQDYSNLVKDNILKSKFMLSDTEIVIYKLAEKGDSQSGILKKLYICESTYKKHVNNILKKIKATSIKRAVDIFQKTLFDKDIDK
jgi:two-component system response regulator DevR